MKHRVLTAFFFFGLVSYVGGAEPLAILANDGLVKSLWESGETTAAAVELRRMAADSDSPEERSRFYLLAAEAYRLNKSPLRMQKMLDHFEDENPPAALKQVYHALRVDEAELSRDWISAALWAEELGDTKGRAIAASDYLRNGSIDQATAILSNNAELSDARKAVAEYAAGHDKSARIGGLLGMIPGMGYAYSGEYGNMIRSMILNGLFGWAMFETGNDKEWGLFAVCTFFEITWYSGSIYGGIDAAHRYNRERLNETVTALRGTESARENIAPRVDLLRFSFSF